MSISQKRARDGSPSLSTQIEDFEKIEIRSDVLHKAMYLTIEELENSIDKDETDMTERKIMLIKKNLREFVNSCFKWVITNVRVTDYDDVDVFEGVEEPYDEELENKADNLENMFNSLLEKRIRQRHLIREQLVLVDQINISNNIELEEIPSPEPQDADDVDWKEVEKECDTLAELSANLSNTLPELAIEYERVKAIL
ncbi:unnamed protein product [Rhizopus stolonifer]